MICFKKSNIESAMLSRQKNDLSNHKLIKEAEEKIIEYIENNPIKSIRECAAIKAEVRSMLSSLLYDNTKRKPIIIVNFTLI